MDTIYEIDGEELRWLAAALAAAHTGDLTLRVTLDGGLKVKVGGGVWSPELGRLDPTCTTGRIRAAVERRRADAEHTCADPIGDGPHVNFEA